MDGRIPEPLIRQRLASEVGASVAPVPVLNALSRQMEIWRFEQARRAIEPQPAQWDSLLGAIDVPDVPTFSEAIAIQSQVRALPALVVGVMNGALFQARGIGVAELLNRLANEPTRGDADLLRVTLATMRQHLAMVKGKRGPRRNVGPALRAVTTAILANSTMEPAAGRNLAADLLRMIGIPAPESRSQLAALMKE